MKKKSVVVVSTLALSLVLGAGATAHAENGMTKEKTEKEIVNQMLAEGYSIEDAEYYAKLDVLVKKWEKEGKEFHVEDAEDISDDYVKTHQKEMRTRILNGDKAAIKKAFQGRLEMNKKASEDIAALVEADREKGIYKNNYQVKYPDGSMVTVTTGIEKVADDETNATLITNTTNFPGPWNSDSIDAYGTISNGGSYSCTEEWRYQNASGTSSVKDTFIVTFNKNGYTSGSPYDYNYWSVTAQSDSGASSAYGIIQIDNENLSNIGNGGTVYGDHWIQGYTDVRFKVSAAFSATFGTLNLSVNGGAQWHQYAVVEVAGKGTINYWAAQYM